MAGGVPVSGRRRWWEPARRGRTRGPSWRRRAEAWLSRTGNDRGDRVLRNGVAARGGGERGQRPDALGFADRILALEDGRLSEVAA